MAGILGSKAEIAKMKLLGHMILTSMVQFLFLRRKSRIVLCRLESRGIREASRAVPSPLSTHTLPARENQGQAGEATPAGYYHICI